MIARHRRDPAPVVDPRIDQLGKAFVIEIGRRLHRDFVGQHDPRGGEHAQEVLAARHWPLRHFGPGLGQEILDDHFLQMAVPGMDIAQRQQRFDPLFRRFADADQHAAGHRHPGAARSFERGQAHGRCLVGRAIVRPALLQQPFRGAFEHQPGRSRDRAQHAVIGFVEHAGIDVRQQPGFLRAPARAQWRT